MRCIQSHENVKCYTAKLDRPQGRNIDRWYTDGKIDSCRIDRWHRDRKIDSCRIDRWYRDRKIGSCRMDRCFKILSLYKSRNGNINRRKTISACAKWRYDYILLNLCWILDIVNVDKDFFSTFTGILLCEKGDKSSFVLIILRWYLWDGRMEK